MLIFEFLIAILSKSNMWSSEKGVAEIAGANYLALSARIAS